MNPELDALISDVDEHYSILDCYHLCMNYLVASLELVRDHIPEPVADCFATAKAHWNGEVDAGELDNARVKCWKYLDQLEQETPDNEKSVAAVRALICALFPAPTTDDTHELLHWFASHLGRVADVDDGLIELVKRYFPRVA